MGDFVPELLLNVITNSTEQNLSWEASQDIPRILEPENSLPCSYQPANCTYPSQINPVYGLASYSKPILILSSPLRLSFPCSLFPSGFPTKSL